MQLKERLEAEAERHPGTKGDPYRALLAVLELHKPQPIPYRVDGGQECTYCTTLSPGHLLKFWPCPTVKAIEQAMGEGDK